MANPVTYADLDEFLAGKGFVRTSIADQHVAYVDRQDEPIFVFPDRPLDQAVQPLHLATARRWLLDTGLSLEEDFERWLCQVRFGEGRREPAAAAVGNGRAVGVG